MFFVVGLNKCYNYFFCAGVTYRHECEVAVRETLLSNHHRTNATDSSNYMIYLLLTKFGII